MEPLFFEQIIKILPQRPPMLLIDRVIELVPGKRAVAIKKVTVNDWFVQGHFPDKPIMPGTLIVEAMAQTSILIYHSGYEDKLTKTPEYYLGSIKAHFMHPVIPGDELRLEAEAVKLLPTGAFINVKAYVGSESVAETELVFSVKR